MMCLCSEVLDEPTGQAAQIHLLRINSAVKSFAQMICKQCGSRPF